MESDFSNESRNLRAALESQGVTFQFRQLHENEYSCRARYSDGRDSKVTYAPTEEEAFKQTANLIRGIWSDVLNDSVE